MLKDIPTHTYLSRHLYSARIDGWWAEGVGVDFTAPREILLQNKAVTAAQGRDSLSDSPQPGQTVLCVRVVVMFYWAENYFCS